jgi:hypothetical protein
LQQAAAVVQTVVVSVRAAAPPVITVPPAVVAPSEPVAMELSSEDEAALSSAACNPLPDLPELSLSEQKRSVSSPTPSSWILPPDLPFSSNAQYNTPYLSSIISYLHASELRKQPSAVYMQRQQDLTPRMREILVDWLVEVHCKFHLQQETLFLCVNIIDRFLERRAVMRTKLQLVGCTALLLAAKYEENCVPEVMDFVAIADCTYTKEEMLRMESIVLQALHFNITTPSPYRFLQRYHMLASSLCELPWPPASRAAVAAAGGSLSSLASSSYSFCSLLRLLSEFLLELTLQEYRFLCYLPSVIAASTLFIALHSLHIEITSELERYMGYTLTGGVEEVGGGTGGVRECIADIIAVVNSATKYRAVRKKYSDGRYMHVSKLDVINPL